MTFAVGGLEGERFNEKRESMQREAKTEAGRCYSATEQRRHGQMGTVQSQQEKRERGEKKLAERSKEKAMRGFRRSLAGWLLVVWYGVAAGLAVGQTRIDLPSQARRVDFSQAATTRPAKTGTVLPGTCAVGELFFLTTATAGQNLYGCAAANTWALLGNAWAGMATGLGDLKVIRESGTQVSVAAGCSSDTPCSLRVGDTVYTYTTPAAATAPVGSGTVRVGVASSGSITAWHNLAGLTCSGMLCAGGSAGWPGDAIALAECTVSGGAFDSAGCQDRRAWLSRDVVTAGNGLQKSGSTLAIGPTVRTFSAGASAPPAVCAVGETYLRTDTNQAYECTSANTWTETSGGGLGDPGANGVVVRTGTNTTTARTITGTANQISVANGDGVAGNPTLSLAATINVNTSGNAATATALASDPADCLAGQYATTIDASGNLICAQVAYSQVSGTPSLAAVALSGSASDLGSGTLAADRGGAGDVSGILKANGSGAVSAAAAGTDYLAPAAIGTTVQGWDADLDAIAGLAKTDDSVMVADGTTWELKALPSCSNGTTDKLLYNATTNTFSCGIDQGGGGSGITSLGGQTGATQTFANDANVTISSSGDTHTLGWSGQLAVSRGGTGLSSGTSGGVPYFSSSSAMTSSAALGLNQFVFGGGAGGAPFTNSNIAATPASALVTITGNSANPRISLIGAGSGFNPILDLDHLGTSGSASLLFRYASTDRMALRYLQTASASDSHMSTYWNTAGTRGGWTVLNANGRMGIGPNVPIPVSTLGISDRTATTGVTRVIIEAGAGQSTANLLEFQARNATHGSGTVYNAVGPTGLLATYNSEATAGIGQPYLRASASFTNQSAAITSGNLLASAAAGLYRATAYLHTTSPPGNTCTATLNLGYTYNSGAKTVALINGHDLNTDENANSATYTFRADNSSNITREVTVSGTCGTYTYDLYLTLERLQ